MSWTINSIVVPSYSETEFAPLTKCRPRTSSSMLLHLDACSIILCLRPGNVMLVVAVVWSTCWSTGWTTITSLSNTKGGTCHVSSAGFSLNYPKTHKISKLVVWISQNPASYRVKPLHCRVHWFLGFIHISKKCGIKKGYCTIVNPFCGKKRWFSLFCFSLFALGSRMGPLIWLIAWDMCCFSGKNSGGISRWSDLKNAGYLQQWKLVSMKHIPVTRQSFSSARFSAFKPVTSWILTRWVKVK